MLDPNTLNMEKQDEVKRKLMNKRRVIIKYFQESYPAFLNS